MRLDKKIYGTTLFVGRLPIETHYGVFETFVFQNLIHKGYILALAQGDLENAPVLYTRLHSSCVTSETLRSTDCDCVLQLEGALKEIQKQKNGVLFYLIQEGRGCGYVGKSRACMMVQYSDDTITTFDAYADMGMKADYRDYSNVYEVAYLLGIEKQNFVLMTNNPDKIKGFEDVGLQLEKIQSIEIEPSPFNQDYLRSKEKYGHLLYQTKKKKPKYRLPHERVEPFTPYHLDKCQRFLYVASYYLPIKPVSNQIIVTEERMLELAEKNLDPVSTFPLPDGTILAKMPMGTLKQIDFDPYWFKVNMYYDLGSYTDYVLLTYGDLSKGVPLVRVHSESLFNRFPLNDDSYKNKYRRAQEEIVKNGCGMILLLHRDGRGSGLSNYVLNRTTQTEDVGIKADARDLDAAAQLIKHQLGEATTISILYSASTRIRLEDALAKQGLHVDRWIPYATLDNQKGHDVIYTRITSNPYYLNKITTKHTPLNPENKYIITGVGTSEAHARYFVHLVGKHQPEVAIKFRPLTFFRDGKGGVTEKDREAHLILVSQGLSPHATVPLDMWDQSKVTLFTAVTESNKDERKSALVRSITKAGGSVVQSPLEDEYHTLIRFVGPFCTYFTMYKYANKNPLLDYDQRKLMATLLRAPKKLPSEKWISSAMECSRIVLVGTYPLSSYWQNLVYKLDEGPFISMVRATELLDFAHGTFQNIEHQRLKGTKTCVAFVGCRATEPETLDQAIQMLDKNYQIWELESELSDDLQILEFETIFNYLVRAWIEKQKINQVEWAGKARQGILYAHTPKGTTPAPRSRADSVDDKHAQQQQSVAVAQVLLDSTK